MLSDLTLSLQDVRLVLALLQVLPPSVHVQAHLYYDGPDDEQSRDSWPNDYQIRRTELETWLKDQELQQYSNPLEEYEYNVTRIDLVCNPRELRSRFDRVQAKALLKQAIKAYKEARSDTTYKIWFYDKAPDSVELTIGARDGFSVHLLILHGTKTVADSLIRSVLA